jgi:hypothetical protein
MKLKITRDTFVAGQPAKAGQTVEVSETDGRNLIAGGKAVPVDKAPQKAPSDRAVKGDDASTRG